MQIVMLIAMRIFKPLYRFFFLTQVLLSHWAGALVLQSPDERWNGRVFPDTSFEGVSYISHAFIDSLFPGKGQWIPDRQKFITEDSSGTVWYLSLDNPFLIVGEKTYNLTFPVRRGPEQLYLPVGPTFKVLKELLGLDLRFQGRELVKDSSYRSDPEANVDSISVEGRENGTLVTIFLSQELKWQGFWLSPLYILKLNKGKLNKHLPTQQSFAKGLVRELQCIQEEMLVQITLQTRSKADTVETLWDPERKALMLSMRSFPKSQASKKINEKRGRKIETVIIDPGHGGKDPGAQSDGVNEADVTLAIGLKLAEELKKVGIKAVMTRNDDTYIPLEERPKFASEQGGDLFVSLHCNAIEGTETRKKHLRGYVTYILREGESEEDKSLARRENKAISQSNTKKGKQEITPLEWILLEHQLNLYSKESEAFAEVMVKAFSQSPIPKYSTGARQAGFYVLVGAFMPAVLFEMGFITNPQDRSVLAAETGQRKIAKQLAAAILEFKDNDELAKP